MESENIKFWSSILNLIKQKVLYFIDERLKYTALHDFGEVDM